MKQYFSLFAMILLLCNACNDDPDIPENSLQAYINDNSEWTSFNELIACAAGGQSGFLDDPEGPLSMFFYPKPYSTNFKYYETSSINDDPADLALYQEREVPQETLFNGFMKRFILPEPSEDVWARVSYLSNDTLWYCKAVKVKYNANPSLFAPEFCEINFSSPLEPIFIWEDEPNDENVIYYQLVSDERGDALSATYTYEQQFQFYNTDNVVLNVTRPGPVLPLQSDKDYNFVLMGVSEDNWVNLIVAKSFTPE